MAHFELQHSSPSETLHIPAVAGQSKVTKFQFQPLHVIVDRESEGRQISLKNRPKVVTLPDQCGNGWQLDDDEMRIAVKLKGRRQFVLKLTAFPHVLTYFPRLHPGNSRMEYGKPIWWSFISPLGHNPDR